MLKCSRQLSCSSSYRIEKRAEEEEASILVPLSTAVHSELATEEECCACPFARAAQ